MKLPIFQILFFMIFTVLTTSSFAETKCSADNQASVEECACLKSNPNSSLEACEYQIQDNKTDSADKKLNLVYKDLLSHLSSIKQKTELTEAQRLWIRLHEKDCNLEVHLLEGIGSPIRQNIIYSGCIENKTLERIKFLEDLKGYLNEK